MYTIPINVYHRKCSEENKILKIKTNKQKKKRPFNMVTILYSSKLSPKGHVSLINGDCKQGKDNTQTLWGL